MSTAAKTMAGCIVFDHDGTLVDSLAVVVHASNQVLAAVGKRARPASEIVAGMVHPTAPRLGLLAGIPDSRVQDDLARLYGELALQSSGLAALYPGVEKMLAAIGHLGMSQAVLSNSDGIFIRSILERLGVASHFVCIAGQDDAPAPKPDPRGLLAILRRVGCEPTRAAYVGDSRTDLETARAAGVRAIGVSWGAHPREELEGLGFDVLVDSPRECLAAIHSVAWSGGA
jgi:phosphoglycolate phosphatase